LRVVREEAVVLWKLFVFPLMPLYTVISLTVFRGWR
jgi:hypothetical protein